MKTTSLLRLAAAHGALAIAGFAAPVLAQDAEVAKPQAEAEDTSSGGSIVVTGSRIQSPTITSVSPVQVVGAEQIEKAGITNVQELLLENPIFGSPTFARTNTAFLTSGTGVATVDLRNLGTDRTLVLINGRRVVAGLPGSATVDLNVIPAQFVKRIDILTGGASSLYGSDAVAGVVNFIYKDDFEGLEANGQYNITERGDTPGYQGNLTVGTNFADDRGNIMVHFGYTNEGQLLSRQRKNTRIDDLDTFINITGDPADYGVPTEGRFSGLPPQGVFTAGGCQFTFSPTNVLERGFSANGGTISGGQATACGVPAGTALPARGFNRQAFRTIAVPVQRYLFATRATYDIADNISFFGEGTYTRTSASRQIEPFGFQSAGSTGVFPSGGLYNIQTRRTNADGTFTIVNNPFVPVDIFNKAVDGNGDGLKDVGFSRRALEFGTRNSRTDRDFYRFVLGLEGDIFADKFHWDVSYNYGRTKESQEGNGQINISNFQNALDVLPAGTIAGTVGPQCASAQARANGCVPVNIFGNGSISPAAVAYIQANQTFQTTIQQQVATANLSGSLLDLPAGPLGIAVGVEYRKEKSRENNDSLTNQGLNGGNALPDTAGSFDVKEAYAEVNIPVLHDTPFFHQLNLRAAGRVSDYSTVGNVYSYSGGVEWAPVEDIRLTATYARAVRAPNIGELFTGPSQTFPTGLTDPCIGVMATGGGIKGDTCRAFAGVLSNIQNGVTGGNGLNFQQNPMGRFDINQSDQQSVSGFNRGNPNLREEKSTSYTIGAIITPRSIDALRNLTLRIDYYNIDIKDAIVGVPRQVILNKCFNEGNQDFCQFIRRRAAATAVNSAGTLEFIDQGSVNGGALKSEGIDFTVNYRQPLDGKFGLPGSLSFNGTYTRLLTAYVQPTPGDPTKDNFKNEIGAAKDRFTATVGYSSEKFDLSFTGTYFGRSNEDDQLLLPDFAKDAVSVPAQFYLDMQTSFKPTDAFEFYIGVDNLLDNGAPNILSGSGFNTTGTDTSAGTYDVFGRRYYAGVRLRY
ncbi:TonB-dependent siderophore receptor [Novosphingobium sp. Gsoil 351]|uniref:TonB-dependent receptor plug domain-containing protein n=1 Tax=Novosphingobium sp. Gsoil 351 TaxID=2675225 RepID=UPI0012B4B9DD|nr:TonB-dependent receptor [Novosphingobium sp. Gsoil 351]QGN55107.1 TonB-dependent receptor [Novosphingobium sp. Gsoil 351]